MELREFIKQTIIQITDGLREGHKYIQDNQFGSGIDDTYAEEIFFDIAVSSNEEETSGIDGKIKIANIFNAGAKDESVTKAANVSRVKFKTHLHVKTKK